MTHEQSRALYDRALSVMPGGVNSAVRAAIEPYPFFVQRGDGGHVIDADGNRYVDWVMGLGPLLLGHDLPETVTAAVQPGRPPSRKGYVFGSKRRPRRGGRNASGAWPSCWS